MIRTVVKPIVSSDGGLHLALPLGIEAANQEVEVTVEPVKPTLISPEESRELILEAAGKWQGDAESVEATRRAADEAFQMLDTLEAEDAANQPR